MQKMLINYNNVNIYQDTDLILKNVNLCVDTHQFIYIIGKVGSGKSSLLKSFYCELDIYKGDADKAEVLGRNLMTLKTKDEPALRREMGIIFQDFQLLTDRNVRDNLDFVLRSTGWKKKDERHKRIREVLEAVGMEERADRYPSELSGGEQQRIAIARSLLNNPKIIIADEPTGNLDPDTAEKIVGLLHSISCAGTTVVISTHNHGLMEMFPGKVYKCEDGHLVEAGRQDQP